ncbi:uncharacterized protein LOC134291918 [Aedes albopictus]|uniref:Integrase catalytic domain-containing protein n=1 Tax=Aedes albopictus TaxID=7160 RepID=A0ABM2A6Y3_AEDAL
MTDDLRGLLKREKRIRDSLDSVASFVRDFKEEDKDEVEVRLQLLESAFHDFHKVREKIDVILDEADEDEVVDTEESEQDRQARLKYTAKKREAESAVVSRSVENCYCKAKSALLKWQNQMRPINPSSAVPAAQPVLSRVKLPEIKLPSFSGVLRDWVSYRDAFQSLIHRNRELTDMDKFIYLRSSLSGDALLEVSSIELSAANYSVAWDALEDRYHNRKLIVKAYLDAIFGIESMRRESYEALSQLISDFEKNLQMLKKMNQDTDSWSTILVHMVCSRLDSTTLRFWEAAHNSKEVPTYRNLITFLKNHCAVLQSVGPSKTPVVEMKKPKISVSHPSTSSTGRCCFCSESFHPAFLCGRFQKMKVPERYDAVRKNGLCMNCLSSGHLARSCNQQPTLQNTVSLPSQIRPSSRQVLLSTAIVRIRDDDGSTMLARALLDSCSQYCFVTSEFCRRMNLKEFPNYLTVKGIGGSTSVSQKAVSGTVSPRFTSISNFEEAMRFNVLSKLTIPLPCEGFDVSRWNLPDRIVLADPEFYQTSDIDMIIGAEYYLDLLQEGRFRPSEDGPTFQNTVFGWIVSGRISEATVSVPITATTLCSTVELQDQLTRFWELESCRHISTYSVEESACEEIFRQTTVRDQDGRFVVTLPRKQGIIEQLGDSRKSAERRFMSLERRFAANPQLKEQYVEFMEEYESMGHMKKVREEDLSGVVYYFLPHHAVLKPDSTTTKLRVVFDASCKTTSGFSLNDGMMVGPVVQDDLISIHARFRLHRIGIVADVAKMYRMISMCPRDQKLQLILWRKSPKEPIEIYQLTTVTYGTASAPFLATRCLVQLAQDGESSHPTAAKVLQKDFYVDDMTSGVDTPEEGKQLVEEIVDLTDSAGLTLRKWNSNCEEVLSGLQPHLRDKRAVHEMDSPPPTATVKTLGLVWCPSTDNFQFTVPRWSTTAGITKRVVISDASKLFDPLGLVGPVVVEAKIFIQTLWKLESNWDDPLPPNLQTFWLEYRRNLSSLESISIPRWVGFSKASVSTEWHGFCDASDNAYGACLYLRSTLPDGVVRIQLMMSKSRVAPLEDLKKRKRKQSTPRLELSSALLLSHLYEKVCQATQLAIPSFFWTDSNIVKYWIASTPSRWQTFVANRVSEIQHLTKGGIWNHVAGVENPADVLSRGISAAQLEYQSLWFNGPVWLHQSRNFWPEDSGVTVDQLDPASLEERKVVALPVQTVPPSEIFSLRSSLSSLVRLIAWIRRFRHNSQRVNRNSKKTGYISSQEYEDALLQLVRLSQAECFPQEIASLSREDQVKDSSKISALNPKLREGVLRVGGRLRNAPVSEDRKHPMVIDHRHPLASVIIQHYHQKMLHSGQQVVIASTRERFWILNIRKLARKVLHECVTCFRMRPRCQEQLMAELPPERVNPAPPFLKVGVDYCGPFLVSYPQRRSPPVKCFVAIFVCLVVKAVHVELVADLTTEAFLAALKRFTARRGRPALIMCDNAKNFVGAKRELRQLLNLFEQQQFQNAVACNAAAENIEFKFIPARSPNFGGLWEAAVKSFKTTFKKVIGTRTLLYDEMQTVLTQVEAVLNSRPLTPVSNDPGDFEALTPGHFLVQRPLTAIAEPDLEAIPANRLSVWQKAQGYIQQLWKKWTTLYLSDLHNRTKWTRQRDNIAVGTMVLLMDERLPPLKWNLGRVAEVFRGSDGNIRVVDVRTTWSLPTKRHNSPPPVVLRHPRRSLWPPHSTAVLPGPGSSGHSTLRSRPVQDLSPSLRYPHALVMVAVLKSCEVRPFHKGSPSSGAFRLFLGPTTQPKFSISSRRGTT